jgi:3-deoxy-7-phosphoheptulonate synthase
MNLLNNDPPSQSWSPVISPLELKTVYVCGEKHQAFISQSRQAIVNILQGKDPRLLVIVGPCSIHDPQAALEYAQRLKKLATQLSSTLVIVMRTYFEKPRSHLGWKGLINDPYLDNSCDINHGLAVSRKLLIDIAQLALPVATEFLDTLIPHYLGDLISWAAIGARTAQSQIHRESASGLGMPVGFKNTTDGNVQIAIDAVNTAAHSHRYLGISPNGSPGIITTAGNAACHIILRGSDNKPNFDSASIQHAIGLLAQQGLTPKLLVDCSHGNSGKNAANQRLVIESLIEQKHLMGQSILGVMLESYLIGGKQPLVTTNQLMYGQSITDACISWQETEGLLIMLAKSMSKKNHD